MELPLQEALRACREEEDEQPQATVDEGLARLRQPAGLGIEQVMTAVRSKNTTSQCIKEILPAHSAAGALRMMAHQLVPLVSASLHEYLAAEKPHTRTSEFSSLGGGLPELATPKSSKPQTWDVPPLC